MWVNNNKYLKAVSKPQRNLVKNLGIQIDHGELYLNMITMLPVGSASQNNQV